MTGLPSGTHERAFLVLDPTVLINKQDVALVPVPGERHPANPVMERGGAGSPSELRVGLPAVRIESGRSRMWYVAADGRFAKYGSKCLHEYQDSYEGMWICYAESSDGIRWELPELGLVEFAGNKRNNVIGRGGCPSFIYDADDAESARRYKCVFDWFDRRTPFSVYTGSSPDGIRWDYDFSRREHESMETPSLFKWGGEYRMTTQIFDPLVRTPDSGSGARRVNALFTSTDFRHWRRRPGVAFALPRQDPMRPGYDVQVHMGIAVFGAGGFCIGVFGRLRPDADDAKVKTSLGLCVSDDGLHFREPFAMFDLLAPAENPDEWDSSMLCQSASSLVEVGDEWWLYYTGSRGGNVWNGVSGIGVARWRKHGFAYLTTLHGDCTGSFETMRIEVPRGAKALAVNAVVPARGTIGVRLAAADVSCEGTVSAGDGTAREVRWTNPVDWKLVAGSKAKLAFEIAGEPHAVRLYSWAFQE